MTRVYLGIGANLNPEQNIAAGLKRLGSEVTLLRVSPGYRSPAMGFDGPDFINLVAEVETSQTVAELNQCLKTIEAEFGRAADAVKYSSRALDIDILLFGSLTGTHDGVDLPRTDVHDYAFVLRPLLDLLPDGVCPQTGLPFSAYLPQISGQDISLCSLDWPQLAG